ncbi:NeuD/PglB/VioB family sugar acetyltransferase [Suttonella indologenes]|uniref:Colanic biosynthesis UDP-glucose lipid carrier transferase n=1 Tax=Suttonella indologenes TaxID=13276 RepID=A0A380N1X1_9GAMM|nr:NeuD/PglB/VioB family sugar acetyltransferase [Suttonella indologenes]SUO97911.1 Putative colanic biosynthesis UDP-glucose lipid carrier transferase [Suttonella indologenes]
MLKRLFDITVSIVALILFLPIYTIVTYKVKKNLGSPVLFRQIRPGLNGKPFEMIKFRTMKDAVDAQGNPLPDSERLTPFGKMLRATSLDELPELWNVLKGDMSLVGPRPLLMEYLPLYNEEQAKRHNVRPGITGYAQVNGRNAISWEQKFALDTWYVENQSFWLDIKILFKTVKKVFFKENISAEGEATISKFTGTKSDKIFAVYGASGCGRSLMPVAKEYLEKQDKQAELCFIDDSLSEEAKINGYRAMNYEAFKQQEYAEKAVLIAIASGQIREKICNKLTADDIKLWSVISQSAVIMDSVSVEEDCAISPFVTLGSNVQIGKSFHANLYSYVEHDCVIGDYVTFAPSVKCNGNVHIGNHTYVGAGAMIKQGTPDKPLKIGKNVVIGMGAVVINDIPDDVTVVGNPARILKK